MYDSVRLRNLSKKNCISRFAKFSKKCLKTPFRLVFQKKIARGAENVVKVDFLNDLRRRGKLIGRTFKRQKLKIQIIPSFNQSIFQLNSYNQK